MFASPGPAAGCDDECFEPGELDSSISKIKELKADINLLNLVNGLNLTKAQIRSILREARLVEKDLCAVKQAAVDESKAMEEEYKLLKSVQRSLNDNKDVSSSLRSRHAVMMERRRSNTVWKLRPQALKRVQESAGRVTEALTPAQQEIISTYKPCLIPPKNLKDPVRVGQAKSTGAMEKFLDWVRALPDPVYANQMDEIIENVIIRVEKHVGVMKEEDRWDYSDRLKDVSERARNMNDVDFELSKPGLAAELDPGDRSELLKECLAEMGVKKYQLEGKVTQFLLVPRIIKILEKRLKQMDEAS